MAALESTASVRGLTTPRPTSFPPNGIRSPARSVAYSRTSCATSRRSRYGARGPIAAAEQRRLVATPVAPTHVHSDPHVLNAFDDPVDQRHGELELLGGIPPRRQSRAHERARASRCERHLGQHGLIELHEGRALGGQLRELGLEQRHHILRERLLRLILTRLPQESLQGHRRRDNRSCARSAKCSSSATFSAYSRASSLRDRL
jgi:hypothetical protein